MDTKKSVNIYNELHKKFKVNFTKSLENEAELLARVEIKSRSFAILGQIISQEHTLEQHQKEIIPIFDELFSDISIGIYFAASSLENPAKIQLRRVLELGIAVTYLWDLPHVFWGWKQHDFDLNFNDMLEHFSKDGYKTYVRTVNSSYKDEDVLQFKQARKLYRILSNTVHGKITTFESNLPKRYSYQDEDWKRFLEMAEEVEDILFDLWNKRLVKYTPELIKQVPALSTLLHRR
ncbi:hypothetical protein PV403_02770 [Paenibacillus sp. GYB006]|uniref:hypothetical protein n=1 Tax=Paenibacillus sp. GYB006 TaxID=2994394 RepID=UPI002F963FAD